MSQRFPSKMPLRAVIFDLDGVLVSSSEAHWQAFRRTFANEGFAFSWEHYNRVARGAARELVLRSVLGDLPAEKLRSLMEAKERHIRDYLRENSIPSIPGAREFLTAVRRRGLKIAVATASRTPRLLLDAAAIDEPFDVVLDRTHVQRPKPFPDLYQATAAALRLQTAECLAIEDSPPGIDSACAADMPVVALTTTHSRGELARANAVYDKFGEIRLEEWFQ